MLITTESICEEWKDIFYVIVLVYSQEVIDAMF